MASKSDTLHLAVPRILPRPRVAWFWAALAVGLIGSAVALSLGRHASWWPGSWSAMRLLIDAWFALAIGVLLLRLHAAHSGLDGEVARLRDEYLTLRRHTAGTAHDMRAPMVTVNSYLELLAAGDFGPLPAAARLAAEQAARASVRARLLVDATLAASVGDCEESRLPVVVVDLNAVLSDVIVSLGAEIARTHARVSVGTLPTIFSNESACYRIFENLVQNALRYAKTGTTPHIEIAAIEGPHGVEVAVRDDGCGIAPDERERVFLDRVRGSNADCSGSGLGLATVRELAGSLGGAVWIDPDVTTGTCVRVRLPAAAPMAIAPRP